LKKFKPETGTSLLEVLVAVAIASIALVSFITLVVNALDIEDNARKITEASLIADDKLKDIERGPFPETGKTEGLIDENETAGFSFRTEIADTSFADIRQVNVEVLWNKGRNSVVLTGYIIKQ
jgi:general secretion pathway protein I